MNDRNFDKWLRDADQRLVAEINAELDIEQELQRAINRADAQLDESVASVLDDIDSEPGVATEAISPNTAAHRPRRGHLSFLAAAAASVLLILSLAIVQKPGQDGFPPPGQPPATSNAPNPARKIDPIEIVVLVDESGSLAPEDMIREQQAANVIAAAQLVSSTVSVVGFGSSNQPGKSAVDVVCPPLRLTTAADRDQIAKCIGDLHKRTPEEGQNTDHAAALEQAVTLLSPSSAPSESKFIVLLTDGKVDVSDSPQWGDTAQHRNEAARTAVNHTLETARAQGIQIWPIGFGSSVEPTTLQEYATGGFQGNTCSPAGRPKATTVADSTSLVPAVSEAVSAMSCVSHGPVQSGELSPGSGLELSVTIPEGATDGSIVVNKGDTRVTVTYTDPQGSVAPKTGRSNSGAFISSGEASDVESLHITGPSPGTWRIRLNAPSGLPVQQAFTSAQWWPVIDLKSQPPPSPWLKIALGGLAVLGLLLLAIVIIGRKRPRALPNLVLRAAHDGNRSYLRIESTDTIRFTVDKYLPVLILGRTDDGIDAYTITRSLTGLRLRTPYGQTQRISLDEEVDIGEGLMIAVSREASGHTISGV